MEDEPDIQYNPKTSAVDKELEHLMEPDKIYEDAELNKYVTEGERTENFMQPIPMVTKTNNERQEERETRERVKDTHHPIPVQGKVRRHRQSAFHLNDKTPLFKKLDTRMNLV